VRLGCFSWRDLSVLVVTLLSGKALYIVWERLFAINCVDGGRSGPSGRCGHEAEDLILGA